MTRERIEDFREIVLPFVKTVLLKTNYERLGRSDAEEFEKHFNEILDLAIQALEQEPRKGHWINTANPRMSDNIVCSECGYDSIADYKYCPCCGSYNGGDSNGNE